nr:MAG TPA: hypothetical protein [Bacteriophage sp.]
MYCITYCSSIIVCACDVCIGGFIGVIYAFNQYKDAPVLSILTVYYCLY